MDVLGFPGYMTIYTILLVQFLMLFIVKYSILSSCTLKRWATKIYLDQIAVCRICLLGRVQFNNIL